VKTDVNESKEIKQEVRSFYDEVGWKEVSDGVYQNARYEDLRPVSREYIHRCHLRVKRHLKDRGGYMLDAGSGPIQYPQYLEYSKDYHYRVCLDISMTALVEARKRVGEHGLCVVGDIAHLPFKEEAFDGVVSLHTIHHLPEEEHLTAYRGLYRVMKADAHGVIVNGWDNPPLVRLLNGPRVFYLRLRGRHKTKEQKVKKKFSENKGTHVSKRNAGGLLAALRPYMDVEIFVWRSVHVNALRFYIRPRWAGRFWLRLLYSLEELFPRLLGRIGAYPLVVIAKK
jgi:SAM-dependent methyltransferase